MILIGMVVGALIVGIFALSAAKKRKNTEAPEKEIVVVEKEEKKQEERENLLRMLRLVCDGNPNVSNKQRVDDTVA